MFPRHKSVVLAALASAATLASSGSSAPASAWTGSEARATAAGTSGVLDLEGRPIDPLADGAEKAMVLLFVRTDCPISNRYAPEVRRLHAALAPRGVVFWLVYPDPGESAEEIRRHLEAYGYRMGALRDTRHELVRRTGVRVTPEAAVFVPAKAGKDGPSLVYRGRIDDRHADLGKMRPRPTTHDLEHAIARALDGKRVARRVRAAVGCDIPELP